MSKNELGEFNSDLMAEDQRAKATELASAFETAKALELANAKTVKTNGPIKDGEIKPEQNWMPMSSPATVYIQYRLDSNKLEEKQRERIGLLKKGLELCGFNVPQPEAINYDFKPSIRFFHSEDGEVAEELNQCIQKFDSKWTLREIAKIDLSNNKSLKSIPSRQLELWIQTPQ